ncbi:MAG: epoxyqueuosine reductase [Gemmatimonadales bacterium]|nr:MAG: epoxyqueuosine reductase [Gemmatimonadales bacterium]
MTPELKAGLVKRKALELGFDAVGVTDLSPPPHGEALRRWIHEGMAGTMRYMERQLEARLRPETILPGATRAVVVTKHYLTSDPPARKGKGRVAKYARGRDYHKALRPALENLAGYIRSLGGPGTLAKPYCDAGPVPERELAQRAGLGWIGKNTMLIDPKRGSYSFIAAILTDLDLATDPPFEADRCGSCNRCLEACPTEAFAAERVLDSRKCISYLTIEYKGDTVEPHLADRFGDWIFGCDICQDVCPWNIKFAEPPGDDLLEPDPNMALLDLEEIMSLSDSEFRKRFGRTAIMRAGREAMQRNAAIVRRLQNGGAYAGRP